MRILTIIIAFLLNIQFAYSIGTDIENSDELSGCWERIIYPDNEMAKMSTKDFTILNYKNTNGIAFLRTMYFA